MSVQGVCGLPIYNIPYVTSELLDIHEGIIEGFTPITSCDDCLWELVKRIFLIFSSIIVYPSLGILTLAGCISEKFSSCFNASINPVDNSIENLIDQEIERAKTAIANISINNSYWWGLKSNYSYFEGNSRHYNANNYSNCGTASRGQDPRQFLNRDNL